MRDAKSISKLDLSGYNSGLVVGYDHQTNKVKMQIPKVMPHIMPGSSSNSNKIVLNKRSIINKNIISKLPSSVSIVNYIEVDLMKPIGHVDTKHGTRDVYYQPEIGSWMPVLFLDEDPNKPIALPYKF